MDGELKRALAPFLRRLWREAAARSGVNGALAVLPLALAGEIVCRALHRPLPGAAGALGAWMLTAALLYVLRDRPTQREAARRIDALGLHEAVGTAVEFQGCDSGMCRMQRAQAVEALERTDPRSLPVSQPVRRGAVCLCLLAALCIVSALPQSVWPDAPGDAAQSDAVSLLQARLDALRQTIETAELRAEDRAQLLAQLDAMQAQLDEGQLDVSALPELSRRMDELAGSVDQLTPVDTYAEALIEIELLRSVGEAIAAEDETALAQAFSEMERRLTGLSGTEQINALMDVVYAIGSSMRRPVRDARQDVLAHAFAVLSGELESAVAMVYNRQDNTRKIAGAFDGAQERVHDFFAGKDLEREEAAQEQEETQRRLSHWADKPGENEINHGEVETVYDPPAGGARDGYVPGALDADGQVQRIAAPDGPIEGEVPYGSVYGAYYAAYLQAQDQLPRELQETAAAYLLSLQ